MSWRSAWSWKGFALQFAATAIASVLVSGCGVGESSASMSDTSAQQSAVVAGVDLSAPVFRWQLPRLVREASGLALTENGTVLVHGDEQGVLLDIDYHRGTTIREIRIGKPVVRGDFEGIVRQGNRLTLMTSDGRLVTGVMMPNAQQLDSVRTIDTGLKRECELEGLAILPTGMLLLPCKQGTRKSLRSQLTVFGWTTASETPGAKPVLAVPFARIGHLLHPSEIVVTPTGTMVLLFGKEHAIGEFDTLGNVLSLWSLDRTLHPQPEGLALTSDGQLLIADEAVLGSAHATLTVYGRTK